MALNKVEILSLGEVVLYNTPGNPVPVSTSGYLILGGEEGSMLVWTRDIAIRLCWK
jgi:hypothetical protein